MSQAYSDPKRASEPYALPDVEVFYATGNVANTPQQADAGDFPDAGWYWWSCFPGCMPDSAPCGPFASEVEALADAQDGCEA